MFTLTSIISIETRGTQPGLLESPSLHAYKYMGLPSREYTSLTHFASGISNSTCPIAGHSEKSQLRHEENNIVPLKLSSGAVPPIPTMFHSSIFPGFPSSLAFPPPSLTPPPSFSFLLQLSPFPSHLFLVVRLVGEGDRHWIILYRVQTLTWE